MVERGSSNGSWQVLDGSAVVLGVVGLRRFLMVLVMFSGSAGFRGSGPRRFRKFFVVLWACSVGSSMRWWFLVQVVYVVLVLVLGDCQWFSVCPGVPGRF